MMTINKFLNNYRRVVKAPGTSNRRWKVYDHRIGKNVSLLDWGHPMRGQRAMMDDPKKEFAPLVGYACDGGCNMYGTDMDLYLVEGVSMCVECASKKLGFEVPKHMKTVYSS